jgi:hypothetical protein
MPNLSTFAPFMLPFSTFLLIMPPFSNFAPVLPNFSNFAPFMPNLSPSFPLCPFIRFCQTYVKFLKFPPLCQTPSLLSRYAKLFKLLPPLCQSFPLFFPVFPAYA